VRACPNADVDTNADPAVGTYRYGKDNDHTDAHTHG
jgi:hypothetical protein